MQLLLKKKGEDMCKMCRVVSLIRYDKLVETLTLYCCGRMKYCY